jgi:hypothetical protein
VVSGDEPGDPVHAEIIARVWKQAARDHLAERAVAEAQVRQASCSSGRAAVWPSVTAVISSTSAPSTKRSRSTECTPVPIIVDAPPISSGVSHHCVSGVRGGEPSRPRTPNAHCAWASTMRPSVAGGDELARADIGRVLAQVEGHAERDARAAARLHHSHGVGDRRGHRLLAQHVLTGFRRLDDVLGMEGVRRAHEDAVDARVLEEVAS